MLTEPAHENRRGDVIYPASKQKAGYIASQHLHSDAGILPVALEIDPAAMQQQVEHPLFPAL